MRGQRRIDDMGLTAGRLEQPPGSVDVTLRPSVVSGAGTMRDDVHAVGRGRQALAGIQISLDEPWLAIRAPAQHPDLGLAIQQPNHLPAEHAGAAGDQHPHR
jgi:hypothetical protein